MADNWKISLERQLLDVEQTPSVLKTQDLIAMAGQSALEEPSLATFHRWLVAMVQAGKLREITKGVYLNKMGRPDASPAAAAQWVRKQSIPSLSWVLEQAWVTNNFGDVITCVIPTRPGLTNPQLGERATKAGTFKFFAMPARLVLPYEMDCEVEDVLDGNFDYPRTTPEKALLDWVYLGASPRSRLQRPPLDLSLKDLDQRRLKRLIKGMGIQDQFQQWQELWMAYQDDPDVRANQSLRHKI